MQRDRDLIVRHTGAQPVPLFLHGLDRLTGSLLAETRILPSQHTLRLQNVRQGGRHVAHFVSGSLHVPLEQLSIRRAAFSRPHGHCGGDNVARALRPVCEAKQPVSADAQRQRGVSGELSVWQTRRVVF